MLFHHRLAHWLGWGEFTLATAVRFLLIPTLTLIVAVAAGLILHRVLFFALIRVSSRIKGFGLKPLIREIERPMRWTMILFAVKIVDRSLPLAPEFHTVLRQLFSLALIATFTWLAVAAVKGISQMILDGYKLDVEDNLLARGVATQVRVLQRIIDATLIMLGIASALMTFESIRQLGVSILASAGVAGIVLGLAAQRSLGSVLAGLQIALTQPIRIDDVVVVEGEWGRIEEITLTYVVIRIWDLRRLVVPITYFVEKPFQNWTRASAELLGAVHFYLDYRVPVDALRAELDRVVRASPLWDGKFFNMQVTDTRENVVEIRALVTAANSSRTFDLRCHVREKMIDFIQKNHPEALPQFRATLDSPPTPQSPILPATA